MGLMSMDDTLMTQLIASFLTGLTAATVTSPIDVLKQGSCRREESKGFCH